MEAFTLAKEDIENFEIVKEDAIVHDLKVENNRNFFIKTNDKDILVHNSGKSFALSTFNCIAARDYNHRVLYTRQTMSSTDNSITEALEGRLLELGIAQEFNVANKLYSLKDDKDGKPRAGKISITGQKTSVGTQTAKLKSLEDFSIFETDEGEELESFDGWKKTKRSMRAKDVQCLGIICFNPPTREHWLYEEFYEDVPDGFNGVIGTTLYIHTTYIDNGKENMAEHNWLEFEILREAYEKYLATPKEDREHLPKKLIKQYKEYRFDILGGFKDKGEGVIYEDWEEGVFPEHLVDAYGQDYGFSRDPTTLIRVAIDHRYNKIHLKEYCYKAGMNTKSIAEVNQTYALGKPIIADGSEDRLIYELNSMYGLEVMTADKPAGSIRAGINLINGYTLVVDPNSHNIKKELNNYVWHDKKTNTPVDNWNHACDAFRYAVMWLMHGQY
jgi:phage terminase large subunit